MKKYGVMIIEAGILNLFGMPLMDIVDDPMRAKVPLLTIRGHMV